MMDRGGHIQELKQRIAELEAEATENEAQIRADMKATRILKSQNAKLREALNLITDMRVSSHNMAIIAREALLGSE